MVDFLEPLCWYDPFSSFPLKISTGQWYDNVNILPKIMKTWAKNTTIDAYRSNLHIFSRPSPKSLSKNLKYDLK
jgi:hypothetical protein